MQEGILELLQLLLGWLVLGGILLWMYWLGVEAGRAAARREAEADDGPEYWQELDLVMEHEHGGETDELECGVQEDEQKAE